MIESKRLAAFLFEATSERQLKWYHVSSDKDYNIYNLKIKLIYETPCQYSGTNIDHAIMVDWVYLFCTISIIDGVVVIKDGSEYIISSEDYPELVTIFFLISELSIESDYHFADLPIQYFYINCGDIYRDGEDGCF